MIQLRKGSIFDSKCDLIIIPCNNMGGVTSFVQNALMVNNLPYFNAPVSLGDILFFDQVGNFANASRIGYAASVDANKLISSEEILRKIMKKLKSYCRENHLHKINIPLLGTGAGGLSPKLSFGVMKEEFEKDPHITLFIYAFSENTYNKLASNKPPEFQDQIKHPRVFISYTGTDVQNSRWVKSFTCRLRENGVDARLDQFHLKPGEDLPQWMTNELIMADKVLLICDKYYAEKADNRKGGVGWETMIIQGDMLSSQNQNKYAAILRDENIDHSLPIYVKSKYALTWTDDNPSDKDFKELLLFLFDCSTEPPLGDIPPFVKEKLSN